MLAIAQLAERLGFDSLWTGEHVLARGGGTPPPFDCCTIGSALAAAVPRVGIGFIVLNSTFRNPVLTAKAAATLDAVSGGRLVLGLGAGFIEAEAQALGTPFPPLPERLRMLEEHFAIVSHLTSAGRRPTDEPPGGPPGSRHDDGPVDIAQSSGGDCHLARPGRRAVDVRHSWPGEHRRDHVRVLRRLPDGRRRGGWQRGRARAYCLAI